MGQEFELKYAATPEQHEKLLAAYGPWRVISMETTYYDTPARTLSRQHITLRRRLENGKSICTVKTPRPDGSRGEWECECDTITQAVALLCACGAPPFLAELTKQKLIPVCGARFTRSCCDLTTDGTHAELALDRGVLCGGGRELPLCEVEIELKSGARSAVASFSALLAARYGLIAEQKSKFRRAMQLAEGE